MATNRLLADLGEAWGRRRSPAVRFESAGGVEVVRRVRAGEQADLVVLAEDQVVNLEADGWLEPDTSRPLFVSDVVAAVPVTSEPVPLVPLSTEEDLRRILSSAPRIGYSTGPSGTALLDLVERWGLSGIVRPKLVLADPGTSVGNLLTADEADLGFQQRSELSAATGIADLGPLPGSAAIRSTFSGAVLARTSNVRAAREVLDFLGSEEVAERVLGGGMRSA
jgi:molybdate transport system substrate-binding protein